MNDVAVEMLSKLAENIDKDADLEILENAIDLLKSEPDAKYFYPFELAKVTDFETKRKEMGMSPSQFYAIPKDPPSASKLPIFDEAHVRAAMARFNQMQGVTPAEKASAARKIASAAKKYGIDVGEFKKFLSNNSLNELNEDTMAQNEDANTDVVKYDLDGFLAKLSAEVESLKEMFGSAALQIEALSMNETLSEYSDFIKSWLKEHPDKTVADAVAAWKNKDKDKESPEDKPVADEKKMSDDISTADVSITTETPIKTIETKVEEKELSDEVEGVQVENTVETTKVEDVSKEEKTLAKEEVTTISTEKPEEKLATGESKSEVIADTKPNGIKYELGNGSIGRWWYNPKSKVKK